MRTIVIGLPQDVFDRTPTPSTIVFREPVLSGNDEYLCVMSGNDADLIAYIKGIIIKTVSANDLASFMNYSDVQWQNLLNSHENMFKNRFS